MRLVLCTFGLIFLKIAYASDEFPQVFNHGEFQDHVDSSIYQDEETYTYARPRFSKLQNFMKQHFAGKVDEVTDRTEPSTEKIFIRHKKHNSHKKRSYPVPQYYGNEVKPKVGKEKDSWDHRDKNLAKEQYPWNENTFDEKSAGTWDVVQNDAVPPLSPVSQSKLDSLGTEEKVREKFQSTYGVLPMAIKAPVDPMEKAALEHYQEMKKRTLCKFPIPKIVKVDDIYPDVLKTYRPACTIIHQCSDESGCCGPKKKCAPSINGIQNVSLIFYVDIRLPNGQFKKTFESLSFMNHTECKCQSTELADRRARGAPSYAQSSSMEIASKSLSLSLMKRCPLPCPSSFSPLFLANGSCICDCTPNNNEEVCLKYKRGEMHFKFPDHHCLFTNQCTYPSCAYGKYLVEIGRCPKQYERRNLH